MLEHRPNTETNIGTSNDNLLEHTMLDIFFNIGQILTAFTAMPRDLLVLKDKEN